MLFYVPFCSLLRSLSCHSCATGADVDHAKDWHRQRTEGTADLCLEESCRVKKRKNKPRAALQREYALVSFQNSCTFNMFWYVLITCDFYLLQLCSFSFPWGALWNASDRFRLLAQERSEPWNVGLSWKNVHSRAVFRTRCTPLSRPKHRGFFKL